MIRLGQSSLEIWACRMYKLLTHITTKGYMKSINTQKLIDLITKFSNERDWDQFHSIKNLSMALNVEASELAEIFQWMSEEKSNSVGSDETQLKRVKEELADVFVYMLRIASKLNIDLEEAVVSKMVSNELKYPVELARGNSKKYDSY